MISVNEVRGRYGMRFKYLGAVKKNGTPILFRQNGAVKTWKSKKRAAEFRIPVKYGLYEYTAITHETAHLWEIVDAGHSSPFALIYLEMNND